MKCSHCGRDNLDGLTSCKHCGAALALDIDFTCYRPSGKIGLAAFPILVCGCLVSLAMGAIYQGIIRAIGMAIFSLLTLACAALALGLVAGAVVRLGHCRNSAWAKLMSAAMAISFIGASFYCDYLLARFKHGTSDNPSRSFSFREWLGSRLDGGFKLTTTGSSDGLGLTGLPVVLIWGFEGFVLLAACSKLAELSVHSPYCEPCGAWLPSQKKGVNLTFWGLTRLDAKPFLSTGRLTELLSLHAKSRHPSPQRLKVSAVSCDGCRNTSYMTVQEVAEMVDNRGKKSEQTVTLLNNVLLSKAQYETLRNPSFIPRG